MANPIKTSDLYQDTGEIKKLIAELELLNVKLEKLRGEEIKNANNLQSSIKKLNATTTTQREEISKSSKQADQISKSYQKYNEAISENNVKLQSLRAATRKANLVAKNRAKLNKSLQGSYDRLSAQYSLNKVRLNAMSESQRFATKEGKRLELQTLRIHTEMDRLQKRTGKATLGVGKYKEGIVSATKSLIGSLGFVGGIAAAGRVMLNSIRNTISFNKQQSKLASVLLKSKDEIKEFTEEAKLYGLTTKFTAIQVTDLQIALAKLGFTASEISLSTKPVIDFATALDVNVGQAAKVAGAALRAFDLDASQMERVVSSLAVVTTKTAAEFSDFETLISTAGPVAKTFGFEIEDLAALFGKLKDAGFEANKAATATRNILLNLADSNGVLAKKLGGSVETFDDLIDGLVTLNEEGVSLNETLELTDKRSVAAFNQFLVGAESARTLKGDITGVNEELQMMVDIQLDNLSGDLIKLASAWDGFILSLTKGDGSLANASRGLTRFFSNFLIRLSNVDIEFTNQRNLTADQVAKWYDTLITVTDGQGKKFQSIIEQFDKTPFTDIDGFDSLDFRAQLVETNFINAESALKIWDIYIGKRRVQAANEVIAQLDKEKRIEELLKTAGIKKKELSEDEAKQLANTLRRIQRLQIDAMSEGQAKELALLEFTFEGKRKEWIKYGLDVEQLVEWRNERVFAINEKWNKKESDARLKAIKKEQDELDKIIESLAAKTDEDRERKFKEFEDQQKFNDAEFALLEKSEAEKTKFKLEAERDRWLKIIELNKKFGGELNSTEIETIKLLIKGIENEIEGIETPTDGDIFDLLGFDLGDEGKQAIKDSFTFAIGQLDDFLQKKVEAADKNVELRKTEVEEARDALSDERENRNQGFAHSVETAEKELSAAKERQAEALAEQKKAQKAQAKIETIQQKGSLITASAKIWGTLGFPFAIPALAIMWGSFIASKSQAAKLTRGKGGHTIIGKGSHASGDDTYLGYEDNGRQVYAEKGEMNATFSRKMTNKYRSVLPKLVDSINNGTFEYFSTNTLSENDTVENHYTNDNTITDSILREIRDKKAMTSYVDGRGRTIVKEGDTTRIYV